MFETYFNSHAPAVVGGALFLTVSWIFAIWVDRSTRYLFVKQLKLDAAVGSVLSRTIRIAILMLASIAVLEELGVEIASLIAALGIFGFAIAIGLRTTSTNFFTGVMILILKPYKVGEYIDGERVEGIVESISVFHTVLVNPEGIYVAVPNGAIWSRSVKNFSRPRPRRIELDITVGRGKPFEEFSGLIDKTLGEETALFPEFAPALRIDTVSDKELKLRATLWCSAEHTWDVKERLSEALRATLVSAGVEVLSIKTPKKPKPVKKKPASALAETDD